MARTGQTVTSKLELRPGSNAAVAVSSRLPMSGEDAIEQLASSLGSAIGATPEEAGERLGYRAFVIGEARPALLRIMPSGAQLREWYARMGAPVGDEPTFYSINIDWRGGPQDIEWPADVFVVPAKSRPVHGAENWPDLDADGYRDLLDEPSASVAEAVLSYTNKAENAVKRYTERTAAALKPVLVVAGIAGVIGLTAWLAKGQQA